MSSPPALSIVVPAFNEADRIEDTIAAWSREVNRLGIVHEVLVYDDGSSDPTPARLDAVARRCPDVRVTRHDNRGHGPTILRGYREARGDWVLQIDGDDEVGPDPFSSLWNAREHVDLLIGRREGRRLGLARRMLSAGAALGVRLWFGGAVADVNSPYRLMRRSMLDGLLPRVPADTFAPNVIITGLAIRDGFTVREQPVPSRPESSRRRASWNAARVAVVAFGQLREAARGRPSAERGRR
jgi:glycosyltransferase involved in cell wall biosynthesis